MSIVDYNYRYFYKVYHRYVSFHVYASVTLYVMYTINKCAHVRETERSSSFLNYITYHTRFLKSYNFATCVYYLSFTIIAYLSFVIYLSCYFSFYSYIIFTVIK